MSENTENSGAERIAVLARPLDHSGSRRLAMLIKSAERVDWRACTDVGHGTYRPRCPSGAIDGAIELGDLKRVIMGHGLHAEHAPAVLEYVDPSEPASRIVVIGGQEVECAPCVAAQGAWSVRMHEDTEDVQRLLDRAEWAEDRAHTALTAGENASDALLDPLTEEGLADRVESMESHLREMETHIRGTRAALIELKALARIPQD